MQTSPDPYFLPLLEIKSLLRAGAEHYCIPTWETSTQTQKILMELVADGPDTVLRYGHTKGNSRSFIVEKDYLEAKGILSPEVVPVNQFLKAHALSDPPIQLLKIERPGTLYAALFCHFKFLFSTQATLAGYDINEKEHVPDGIHIHADIFENETCYLAMNACPQGEIVFVKRKEGRFEFKEFKDFLPMMRHILLIDTNIRTYKRGVRVHFPKLSFHAKLPSSLLKNISGKPEGPIPTVDITQFEYHSEVRLNEHGVEVKGIGAASFAPRGMESEDFFIDDNFIFFLMEQGKMVGAAYVQKEHFVREK